MASVNKIIVLGNVGRDPDLRVTQGGQAVANFSVATSETWADKSGAKQERTEWHRIVAFGKLAELVRDYVTKGRQVYVEGKIQTREYTGKDGEKKHVVEVIAHQVVFLGGGRGEQSATRQRYEQATNGEPEDPALKDDDIPF